MVFLNRSDIFIFRVVAEGITLERMKFKTPRRDIEFEIPDEWLSFCATEKSVPEQIDFYPYSHTVPNVQVVDLSEIEPPQRGATFNPLKKFKLVPVLMAFQSPECELPPVEVVSLQGSTYSYRVTNGYHRYYGSVSVGYKSLPVLVRSAASNAFK